MNGLAFILYVGLLITNRKYSDVNSLPRETKIDFLKM